MPAFLVDHRCRCGQWHALYSPDTFRVEAGVVYEYVCPGSGRTVRFTTKKWTSFEVPQPPKAVLVRRAARLLDDGD